MMTGQISSCRTLWQFVLFTISDHHLALESLDILLYLTSKYSVSQFCDFIFSFLPSLSCNWHLRLSDDRLHFLGPSDFVCSLEGHIHVAVIHFLLHNASHRWARLVFAYCLQDPFTLETMVAITVPTSVDILKKRGYPNQ